MCGDGYMMGCPFVSQDGRGGRGRGAPQVTDGAPELECSITQQAASPDVPAPSLYGQRNDGAKSTVALSKIYQGAHYGHVHQLPKAESVAH